MDDADKKAQEARAKAIRAKVKKLIDGPPPDEAPAAAAAEEGKAPPSPREFIQREMAKRDKKPHV